MKTSTISTTLCRKTGKIISQTITENKGKVNSMELYLPLVETLYKDMEEKGFIKEVK